MLTARQRIRVEWAHCDPARIIFNANYYIWMDQGTHALLQHAGFDLVEEIKRPGARGCPLVASSADFLTPAYFGDLLEMTSAVERFGTKSFTVAHTFARSGEVVARGREVRVWGASDADDPDRLIAVPVPEAIRSALAADGELDTTP